MAGGDQTSPISVILVSSGSRGNKLLFRYPFQRQKEQFQAATSTHRSPFALHTPSEPEDQDGDVREQTDSVSESDEQVVAGFSDVILATILAPKSELCGKRFELKIDNVLFVGHPTLLQHSQLPQVSKTDPSPKRETPTMILFNVVFALRAHADPSVLGCMHNLSRRMAVALRHEERRCQYLTREAKLMLAVQDEISALHDGSPPPSPFHHILPKSKLARDLKEAYDNLCSTGLVQLYINNWLEVSFCLPHKVHKISNNYISPEAIERSLKSIRPYHALLLLGEEKSLLSQLPADSSPSLVRLIKVTSPMKTLQQLAQDADLALLQVFQLAAHLVYWGKATVIYPLCETNVYMLSPSSNTYIHSPYSEQFAQQFPGCELSTTLTEFSLPTPLAEHRNPLGTPVQQTQLVHTVMWMLQRRMLMQLHTYVCLMVPAGEESASSSGGYGGGGDGELQCAGGAARATGCAFSAPTALVFGSPPSSDDLTLTSPSLEASSVELGACGEDSPVNRRVTENLLASLPEHERSCINAVPAAHNPEDLRLFARLLPYFRGYHHLEEIMYHENVRRSQLLTLIDKFRSVLVVLTHEDPIISIFHSPTE
ncbi:GATOR1 complex protein NPRL3 isoform X1 [Lethenteron reissneri]|uniref:GATOR1 complex protein NPRL3 isoform X1 n=1 Tax=Lethenteron reissneri TaxID=7753 RepID=UPI002AB5F2BB|nr:GATOR1 complex protein NPRL3 isoform X1 [Lethenteron reissneri]